MILTGILARAPAAGPAVAVTASRTAGTAPAGIVFEAVATGFPVARPFHDLRFEWRFADAGDFAALPADHPQGRGRDIAYGPVTSHVFRAPGTYGVTCTVTDGTTTLTAQRMVTVADPDTVFQGTDTLAVAPSGDFSDAPAGAAQYTDPTAALAAAAARAGDVRVLLRRGEDHRTGGFGFTRFNNDNRLFIGAYGTGARPVIDRNIRLGENDAMFSEIAVHGIEIRGDYDAAAFPGTLPALGEGITHAGNVRGHVTVFDCRLEGMGTALRQNGIEAPLVVADTEITNWQDFGMLVSDTDRLGLSGCHIHQKPDAVMNSDKTDAFPHHGPVRISKPVAGGAVSIRNSALFTVGGWAGIDQQCIRWNAGGTRGARAVIDGNLLEGGWYQIAGHRTAESGGLATSSPGALLIQRNLCVMSPGSVLALNIGYGGTTARNNLIIRPEVAVSPLVQDDGASPAAHAIGFVEDAGRQDPDAPANHDQPVRIHHNSFVDLATDTQLDPGGGTTLDSAAIAVGGGFFTDLEVAGNLVHAPNRTNPVTADGPLESAVLGAPRYAQWRGGYDITVNGTTYAAGTAHPFFAAPPDTISLYRPTTASPALEAVPAAALDDFFGTLRGGTAARGAHETPVTDPLAAYDQSGQSPALVLDFVAGTHALDGVTGPLSGIVGFARSSPAWSWGSDGTLVEAAPDTPRIGRDRATGAVLGYLVEEARTNLLLDSATPATQTVAVADGTVYTLSVFGAGSAALSGAGSGTASEGAPVTFTATGTGVTVTVTGALAVFQLEAGDAPTSPIVTGAAPVTRAADRMHVAKSLLPGVETLGTALVAARMPARPAQRAPLRIGGSGALAVTKPERTIESWDGTSATVTANAVATGGLYRYAVAYDAAAGSATMALDGTLTPRAFDADGWTSFGEFGIGHAHGFAGEYANTAIAEIRWYPVRLSDTDLAALTG